MNAKQLGLSGTCVVFGALLGLGGGGWRGVDGGVAGREGLVRWLSKGGPGINQRGTQRTRHPERQERQKRQKAVVPAERRPNEAEDTFRDRTAGVRDTTCQPCGSRAHGLGFGA